MHHPKVSTVENPRNRANSVSQLLFVWIVPTLYEGSRKGLDQENVTKCLDEDRSEVLGDTLEAAWELEIIKAKEQNRAPSFRMTLFKTFASCILWDGLLNLGIILLRTAMPVILAKLLLQFRFPDVKDIFLPVNETVANTDDITYLEYFLEFLSNVYVLSTLLVLSVLLISLLQQHSNYRLRMVGARIRIACCSLIYRKTIKLSKKSVATTSAGYVVNLLSNDVSRFDYSLVHFHYLWLLPLQCIITGYLLWNELGYAAIICILDILLKTLPVQSGFGHLLSKFRLKIAKITDERVGVMNEIIRGIQVIKMYAWEKPFAQIVAEIRRKEIQKIRLASYIKAVNISSMIITERSTLFLGLLCRVLFDESITADVVFSMALFFNALQLSSAHSYPYAIEFGSEAMVSAGRIEKFLLMEDRQEPAELIVGCDQEDSGSDTVELDDNAIEMKNVTASWDGNDINTLDNISLTVKRGQLCAIIGSVGSGKSSFLEQLLGELPIHSGTSKVNGTISYASQDSWLFTATVRANIIFDQPYDRNRYNEVVKRCALETDFQQLPNGDKTIVGERGASLSGGQQARINLARTIYKNASIYLLDDPLSAVDARIGGHLFKEIIGNKGCLASMNATRILVTHQVHFLQEADIIVVLNNGRIVCQGTYDRLANSNLECAQILRQPPEESVEEELFTEDGLMYDRCSFGQKSKRKKSVRMSIKSVNSDVFGEQEAEEQGKGSQSITVWKRYFNAGANWFILSVFILFLFFSQFVISGSDYFVNFWVQQEELRLQNKATYLQTIDYLYIYAGLIVGVLLVCIIRSFSFYTLCMRSSIKLHNTMFSKLLSAPMRFFDINPSGRIMNRFSKDMGTIDEYLPKVLIDSIQIFLVMLGISAIVSILNPLMIAALIGSFILFLIVLKLYTRPAQDLKRLEGIAKSPVFSHLSATLFGISTIRSRNQQSRLVRSFDMLQNMHSGIWHFVVSSNSALCFWVDIVCTIFIGSVTYGFAALQGKVSDGDVGLAISQAMMLTGMVQYGVRQSAESLQAITSVERVLQYTDIEQEVSPSKKPPKNWPEHGHIKMIEMSLSYDKMMPPVLKNLSLDIKSGWKIGIVGRTGAGKSSLINAVFRLSPISGQILIDDIDTGEICLNTLRSKISIIPQDPVLFSDTIRNNLDPFHVFDDDALWRVLTDVELKSSIDSLDFYVTEGGTNFSVGQRQLICLARAILRNNRILVLDEATANVDPQTDALIQHTIRNKFHDCTVLTIAHRLHTVMDSDRILVMDDGMVKEFDYPHILMQNHDGYLRSMADAAGPLVSAMLRQIASDSYEKNENRRNLSGLK